MVDERGGGGAIDLIRFDLAVKVLDFFGDDALTAEQPKVALEDAVEDIRNHIDREIEESELQDARALLGEAIDDLSCACDGGCDDVVGTSVG